MTRKINNSYLLGQSNAPTTGGDMLKTRSDGTPVWEEVDAMALYNLSWNGGRGVVAGGYAASPVSGDLNSIEYITIATTGNGTDFGDLSQTKRVYAGMSNGSRGVFAAGNDTSSPQLEYITFASTGNARGKLVSAGITVAENATIPGISGVLLNEGMLCGYDVIVLLVSSNKDMPDFTATSKIYNDFYRNHYDNDLDVFEPTPSIGSKLPLTIANLTKLEKESKIIEEQIQQARDDTKKLGDNIYR